MAASATVSCHRVVGIYLGQHDGGRRDARPADSEAGAVTDASPAIDLSSSADVRMTPVPPDAPPAADTRGGDEPPLGDAAVTTDATSFGLDSSGADASADAEMQGAADGAVASVDGDPDDRDAPARPDAGGAGGAGTGGPPDAASPDQREPPPQTPCAPAWRADNVEARVFTLAPNAQTACSIGSGDRPMLAASVDDATFRNALACGACLEVRGTFTSGTVTVRVVDRAGGNGGILLTRAAMDQISPGGSSVRVDWRLVPCETAGRPVRYYVKEDSNSGYVGIQVRDARYPVAKMSAVGSTTTLPLTLQSYNYWTSSTLGLGTVTLRITDIHGQVLDDPGIVVRPRAETAGRNQFPRCR